jgi:hypothetical protein
LRHCDLGAALAKRLWKDRAVGLIAASLVLAALLGPDFLPPAPLVVFTQVDARGGELGSGVRAQCAGVVCRATLRVRFDNRSCVGDAVVTLPLGTRKVLVAFSIRSCSPRSWPATVGVIPDGMPFSLDSYGAMTQVAELVCQGESNEGLNDLVAHICGSALLRVDIVLWTTARP